MLVPPNVLGGNGDRPLTFGDVLATQETVGALATVGAGTLTGLLIARGAVDRTGPVGAYTDTTDTAVGIINAMRGGGNASAAAVNFQPLSQQAAFAPGTTFRFLYRNTVAFAMTLAAGANVVLGNDTAVAASQVREYLITILTSTDPQTFTGVHNATTTISGFTASQLAKLSLGMGITGASAGASAVINGINPSAGTVLASVASTASSTEGVTFNPRVNIRGLRSSPL